jgi:hypothetical protein
VAGPLQPEAGDDTDLRTSCAGWWGSSQALSGSESRDVSSYADASRKVRVTLMASVNQPPVLTLAVAGAGAFPLQRPDWHGAVMHEPALQGRGSHSCLAVSGGDFIM